MKLKLIAPTNRNRRGIPAFTLREITWAVTSNLPMRRRRSQGGFTMPEMVVAAALGLTFLTVIAVMAMTSARSFAAVGNYVDMNSSSRNAVDHMTLGIRQSGDLVEYSPTRLKFTVFGATNSYLIYNWDSASGTLTEWKTGNAATNVLLTHCDQLNFSLCNSAFVATTNIALAKGVNVNWACSRTTLGKNTTENMQQALIVLRNKPL